MGAEHLVEAGKATRFKEGNPGGPGRPKKPIVQKALEMLEAAGVEERIAKLWVEDAQADDPTVRMHARRDLMDRFIGKPTQAIDVTIDEPEGVDWGGESA